jgi:tetratricopeptide (TPR) repeat protein
MKNKKRKQSRQPQPQRHSTKQAVPVSGGAAQSASGRGAACPNRETRQRIIRRISDMAPQQRSPADWYSLGELLTVESILQDDSALREQAIEALQTAAAAVPCIPDALLQLTLLLNFQGLPGLSLPYARKAAELLPDDSDAWKFLADTLSQQNETAEAVQCYRRAMECENCSADVPALLAALEAAPAQNRHAHVIIPILLDFPEDSKRTQESRDEESLLRLMVLRQLLKLRPDDSDLLMSAARLAYQLNRFPAAATFAEQLTALDASNAEVWELLGLIAEKTEKPEEALDHYNRSLQCDGCRQVAGVHAAAILISRGKMPEARTYLTGVLAANPENADALTCYADTIVHLEEDYELALSYNRRAMAAGAASPAAVMSFCLANFQAGHLDEFELNFARNQKRIRAMVEADTTVRMRAFGSLLSIINDTLSVARWDPVRAIRMMFSLAQFQNKLTKASIQPISRLAVKAVLERIWKLKSRLNGLSSDIKERFHLGFAHLAKEFDCFPEDMPAV